MADLLGQLQELIAELPKDAPGASVELLLAQMEPTRARLVRLCAIPHQFFPGTLQVLLPSLDAGEADACYQAISHLPMVVLRETDRAIHDEARAYLFRQWLKRENQVDFVSASARLAGFFRERLDSAQGERRENLQRQHVFHLFGADQTEGFQAFERVWAEQYGQFRLGGCQTMVKLLREYEPVLSDEHRAWLTYFEGMLATDTFQTQAARGKFESLLKDPVAVQIVELRAESLARLGQIATREGDWLRAIQYLRQALDVAQLAPGGERPYRILHDLGVASRELGDLDAAGAFFHESLKVAEKSGDASAVSIVHNGLGTLYLKMGDTGRAIAAYNKALEGLLEGGDRFRSAQVYNNLGMAHIRAGNLAKSRDYFETSLKIKREAGDTLGQAMTLNNLVPLYQSQGQLEQAIAVARSASDLFLEIREVHNAALAKGNLGRLYKKLGDAKSANQAFSESEELFKKCGRWERAGEIRDLLVPPRRSKMPLWVQLLGVLVLFLVTAVLTALLR
jgi:tetratricopeptide (TPR) repeat protein